MAITTDLKSRPAMLVPTGGGIAAAIDRSRDFRRASRHSWLVRILRIAFPALSLSVISLYGALFFKVAGVREGLDATTLPSIIPENLTMQNPRYEGYAKDGGSYVVSADTASQNLGKPTLITLNGIKGVLTGRDSAKTSLTATRGTFDTSSNGLELYDGIEVAGGGSLRAELRSASVDTKEGIITSKEPVLVEMAAGTVRSREMTIRQKVREVTFVNSVEAMLKPQAKAGSAPEQPPATTAQPLFGASDQPVQVTSSRLDVNDTAKTAIFSGGVKAIQGESTLSTPELEVQYEGDAAPTADSLNAAAPQAGKIRTILAKAPVVMTRAQGDQVTSSTASFDALTNRAVLEGGVTIASGADRHATGERAELDQRADTALLVGNVVLMQGRNELRGQRLFVDHKAGRTQLTSPPEAGHAAGRIFARFYQNTAGQPGQARKNETPAPDGAQGLGISAFKTDPNAPVIIDADTLDVNDPAKSAVFRGDVRAVQGDIVIRTSELIARYSGSTGILDRQSQSAANRHSPQLTKIEARQKVVVTSKSGQTATGDWADFDMKTNTAVLGGDVVLTQGQNVVRGTRLTIDTTSGHSVIQTDPGTANTPTGTKSPLGSNRPSIVFYPKQLKEKLQEKLQPSAGSTSSWEVKTNQ